MRLPVPPPRHIGLLQFIRSPHECHPACCAFLWSLQRTSVEAELPIGVQFHPIHQLDADRRARGQLFHSRAERSKHGRIGSAQRPYAQLDDSGLILHELVLPDPAGVRFEQLVQ